MTENQDQCNALVQRTVAWSSEIFESLKDVSSSKASKKLKRLENSLKDYQRYDSFALVSDLIQCLY